MTWFLALAIFVLAGAIVFWAIIIKETTSAMALNLGGLSAAVSDLETRAMPGETSGDQAAIDQLATRVTAVTDRFAPAAPVATPTPPSAPATDTSADPNVEDSTADKAADATEPPTV